ncbi:vacuolar protein sorting/secretion protein [Theileria orientalis]|uniref:Vacuolar protein sorting/secretion protein n=1 Tax=Theileria orientalis TaxID=68886 RepID=A0A976M9N1_THEOR|nr:vacuolar protein sorting/secretion protein [Theileria orientalis]
MIFLEQIVIDAKNEFFCTILEVIDSIKRHSDYKNFRQTTDQFIPETNKNSTNNRVSNIINDVLLSKDQNSEDSFTKNIATNNIALVCSNDVYNLLNHLFNNGICELGFLSIDRIEDVASRQAKTIKEDYDLPKHNEVFMIRPTFRDSHTLSMLLKTRHMSVIRVVCLPEISEVYPQILSHLLGKNFNVCKYGSNTPYTTNQVELFQCSIHIVPVDGILSMVMSNCYSDFYLHGDPTTAWFFAKALEYLQKKHLGGAILNVVGLGILSKYVIELLLKKRRDMAANLIVDGIDKVQNEKCFIPLKLLENYQKVLINDLSNLEKRSNSTKNELDTRLLLCNSPTFKSSIIIDRKVDLITPMCTNFTYEGLLDSVFGVRCNLVNVDTQALDGKVLNPLDLIVDFQKSKQKHISIKKTVSLSSQLYDEIRWLDFSKVGSYLHEKALRVKKGYEGGGMQTIGEMGEFVKKFKTLQQEHANLSTHINIMGYLNSYVKSERFQLIQNVEDSILQSNVEAGKDDSRLANISKLWTKKTGDPYVAQILDLIFWNTDVRTVLRLVVLLCQTMDGLKQADFNTIKRAIIFQYGFVHLKTIQNFIKCGLIKVNNTGENLRWQKLCSKFNLLVESEFSSTDCSGIFGGYAPLSIRIAQLINVTNDCAPLSSEFSFLNAQIVSTKQKSLNPGALDTVGVSTSKSIPTQNISSNSAEPVEKCLLCYIGGITIGEVAAISLLNSLKSKYLVLATDVINSSHLIKM